MKALMDECRGESAIARVMTAPPKLITTGTDGLGHIAATLASHCGSANTQVLYSVASRPVT
jgi:hypothetical protein